MTTLPDPQPIREVVGIDRRRFDEEIRPGCEPVVMRGLAAHWPAVAAGRTADWELVDYLLRFASPRPVAALVGAPEIAGRFFYTEDLARLNFQRSAAPLEFVLRRLLQDAQDPRPHAMAVQSEMIDALLPGFGTENEIDLLSPSVRPRIWIGNSIRVAPHYDLMENIGIVVGGRRRFTLFPPDQISNLYVGPFELTPAGTPVSLVDLAAPDLERFPRYTHAAAVARSAVLEPGDAIYIPYHWWHGVDSLAPVNAFVNYWWNDAPPGLGDPYSALLFGVYTIRNLPPDQRAAWRETFDNFVFQTHGDAAAHLPPAVRSFLGAPTPDMLARLKDALRKIAQSIR